VLSAVRAQGRSSRETQGATPQKNARIGEAGYQILARRMYRIQNKQDWSLSGNPECKWEDAAFPA